MPKLFVPGSPVWLWLGSDNNAGRKTEWKQGIRALAVCAEKSEPEPGSFVITLDDVFILPETIERPELLEISPETYANNLIDATIVGLNNYASQVVQLLEPEEFATIAALIAKMLPSAADELFARVDGADEVVVIPRHADISSPPPPSIEILDNADDVEPDLSELDDDDLIYQEVVQLVVNDGMGGALLLGAPGTGKSWYARQIAKKLVGGDRRRFREIQFHPSYQYEDFVEGYVPDSKRGFRQVDKHLLQMVEIAKNSDGLVVLVIDEFSRTDPARVMGEAMTYMEGSLRGVSFSLPSGRRTDIPKNLVFLATMNPDDRSVDEIDAAMDRRWAKLVISPDVNKVRQFLDNNSAPVSMRGPTLKLFAELQSHMAVGHAFFRTVRDNDSLARLWQTQLIFAAQKKFRFDPETLAEIESIWDRCWNALTAPQDTNSPQGEPEATEG